MFQDRDRSFCRQIPPSPRKSRSFPVAIISRFAAYNVQSEGRSFTDQMKIACSMKKWDRGIGARDCGGGRG